MLGVQLFAVHSFVTRILCLSPNPNKRQLVFFFFFLRKKKKGKEVVAGCEKVCFVIRCALVEIPGLLLTKSLHLPGPAMHLYTGTAESSCVELL